MGKQTWSIGSIGRSGLIAIVASVLLTIPLWPPSVAADVGGGLDPDVHYSADHDWLTFQIDIDSTLFGLPLMSGYQVVRVQIQNYSDDQYVELSAENDNFTAETDDGDRIVGLLDLHTDPAFWNSLSQDSRNALAYPVSFEADDFTYFYVFFKEREPITPPARFIYRIAELNSEIVIESWLGLMLD